MYCRNTRTSKQRPLSWLKAGILGAALAVAGVSQAQITVPGSHANLAAAFAAINAGTFTGAVTIDITGSYTEPAGSAVLHSSGAVPASYTSVTIRPVNPGTVITGTTVTGRGIIELNGADNVTIDGDAPGGGANDRNLTIINNAANTVSQTSCIRLAVSTLILNADNNTIKNCILRGSGTGRNISANITEVVSWGVIAAGGASTVSATTAPSPLATTGATISGSQTVSNLRIQNNEVQTASRGIAVNGAVTTAAPTLNIIGNEIGNATAGAVDQVYTYGISVQGSTSALISQNTIRTESFQESSTANPRGIDVGTLSVNTTGVIIERNSIERAADMDSGTWPAFGINLGGGSGHIIRNNCIRGIMTSQTAGTGAFSTTFGSFGIRIASGTGHKVLHNNVVLTGAVPGATSGLLVSCLSINSGTLTGCDVRNNIFSNQLTGGALVATSNAYVCVWLTTGLTSTFNLTDNNNAYYQGSTIVSGIAQTGTTAGTNFFTAANFAPGATTPATNWRSYTSTLSAAGTNDNASFAVAAGAPLSGCCVDISNPGAPALNGTGATGTGVTDDLNGALRASPPDIGTCEFNLVGCTSANGGTVTPGTATGCETGTYTMTSTGADAGGGITYMWEVSSTGGGVGFADVSGGSGANTTSYTTGALSIGTLYYRLRVTCSNGPVTGYSNELTLTTGPGPGGVNSGPATGVTYSPLVYTVTGQTPGFTFAWQFATAIGGPYTALGVTTNPATLNAVSSGTFFIRCLVTAPTAPFCVTTTNAVQTTITVANDNVCSAIPIVVGTNGPYTNQGATVETGEPTPPNGNCTSQLNWCDTQVPSNSVWFSFVAPASGKISLNFGTTATWDSELALWSAASCTAMTSGGATLVAANDDSNASVSPFFATIFPLCVTPGATYYVQVDGYSTTTNSAFQLVLVDGGLVCNDGDPCTTDSYNCAGNVCVFTPIVCNDGDACTTDACVGGVCQYTPIVCNDGDACTTDACVGGVCQYTPIVCNDGDACTTDACVGGVCQYTPVACNDGDACTTDACVGGVCQYTPIVCNDGDGCTTDACVGGVCQYTPVVCNDGDACTTDACVGGVCQYTPVVCNDGDACTTDACVGGVCQYTPINCDDGDGCTTDGCSGGTCTHTPVVCDDGNACTTDACVGGVCVYTPPVPCDDGDPCTTDTYDCNLGQCVFTPIVCNDGDACTTDACVGGVCQYTPINCDDGDACTTDGCLGGTCTHTPVVCNDGDPCTTDACVGGVCQYTPIVCNDGDACTTDACVGGNCVYTPVVCNDGDACTTDACVGGVCQYTPIVCNDGDACTTDACVGGVCVYTPINCDDGDPNTVDGCVGGTCTHVVGCANNFVSLELKTDGAGAQTTWDIVNISTTTVVCSGPVSPYGNNQTITEYCCLADGCYELRVKDSFGDGMTTGGYRLKDQFGNRIIDNWNDGAFGTLSQIALNTGFCLDMGTDQLTPATCDQETLSTSSILQANENLAVTAQYGITNSTSGYQFLIYNPDGGYVRYVFQNMTAGAGTGAQKSRSLLISSLVTSPVPSLQLLNVKVRSRVAGTYAAFGPACRMKINPAGSCPTTQLDNIPANTGTTYSCGVTGRMVGGMGLTGRLYTIPVGGATNYRFRLVSGAYTRTITVTTYYLTLGPWSTQPLLCGTHTYNVDVSISKNSGASYCPYGPICTVGITNPGGSIPCTTPPSFAAIDASESTGVLAMWPNPNRGDQLYLQMTGIDASVTEVSVDVHDLFGKRVMAEIVNTDGGDLNHVMQLSGDLASGMYNVTVTAGDQIKTQRLVIE